MFNVSVVIPLYNKEKHIARAISSVLNQTVQDFEVVVVDDGSTDKGADYVKFLTDSRIRLIQQPNAGVSAARNKGIEEAKADLIAFLDADDEWKPEFLETVLRLRNKYPQAGAYATAYEVQEKSGRRSVPAFKAIPASPWEGIIPNYFESILGQPPVWSSAVMIPKDVFKACGCFPVGEKLGEDLDMWLRVALKYKVAFSTKICSTYFQDVINNSCANNINLKGYRVLETAENALISGLVVGRESFFLKEYMNRVLLWSIHQCLVAGEKRVAKAYLKRCRTKIFIGEKINWSLFALLPSRLLNALFYSRRNIKLFVREKINCVSSLYQVNAIKLFKIIKAINNE